MHALQFVLGLLLLPLLASGAAGQGDGVGDDDVASTTAQGATALITDVPSAPLPLQTTPPAPITSPSPIAPSSPISTPTLQVFSPGNLTTCERAVFRWDAPAPEVQLTVTITNDRAEPLITDADLISRTLVVGVASSAEEYVWDAVDVPEGLYLIVAFDAAHTAGLYAQSPLFFVGNGTDTSCLAVVPGPALPPTFAPSTTRNPAAGDAAVGTSASPPAASKRSLTPLEVAGVVVAVVVGVALLVFGLTVPAIWVRMRSRNERRLVAPEDGPYNVLPG